MSKGSRVPDLQGFVDTTGARDVAFHVNKRYTGTHDHSTATFSIVLEVVDQTFVWRIFDDICATWQFVVSAMLNGVTSLGRETFPKS